MEIVRPEITDQVVGRINSFLQTRFPKSMIPKCFGDPLLRCGLCSPKYPLPPASPEIPKPILCGLYHICTIHLAEFLKVKDAEGLPYEKLFESVVRVINETDKAATALPATPEVTIPVAKAAEVKVETLVPPAVPTQSTQPAEEWAKDGDIPLWKPKNKPPFRTSSLGYNIWLRLSEPGKSYSWAEIMSWRIPGIPKGWKAEEAGILVKAREMGVLEETGGMYHINWE